MKPGKLSFSATASPSDSIFARPSPENPADKVSTSDSSSASPTMRPAPKPSVFITPIYWCVAHQLRHAVGRDQQHGEEHRQGSYEVTMMLMSPICAIQCLIQSRSVAVSVSGS